jgi:hypothetical protein
LVGTAQIVVENLFQKGLNNNIPRKSRLGHVKHAIEDAFSH